ncbi:MAG TPA: hypothetical protein VKR22_14740 [Acidimicrobiales bacterium]|nr:hypothetical protein [Acidimicrobiales bacterium]
MTRLPSHTTRVRVPVLCAVAIGAVALSACSGSPAKSAGTAPHITGLTGIGATTGNWGARHQVFSAGAGTYGPEVQTDSGRQPTYLGVHIVAGHVTGWVMNFGVHTTLAEAEFKLDGDLPPDVEQTASSRETTNDGAGACEVVNFMSTQAQAALSGVPALASGRFSVSFYELQASGAIASSYVTVNRAVVGVPGDIPGPACPS